MALVVIQLWNTNKVTSCSPAPRLPCGLSWLHRHWTSTQNLAGVDSWTQTWSSAAAWPGCNNCPKWQYRLFRLLWPQRYHGPSSLTCPQVVAKTTDICKALMVLGVTDISTDPGCMRTMDPAIALSCRSGPDITGQQVAAQATHVCIAPPAVWCLL